MKILIILMMILPSMAIAEKRDLSFLHKNKITISEKKFGKHIDKIFVDPTGREAHFRGWNFHSNSKGFPFLSYTDEADLRNKLSHMKAMTGSNIIRWLVHWEGINPEVDVIDTNYLRKKTFAIKIAIKMGFHILIDFHTDTFSRHVNGGANGAPKYVVDGMDLDQKGCRPKFLCFSWAINYFLNKGVKEGLRNFWNNVLIDTTEGKRYVQDEYIWMMRRALLYWKENLSKKEFKHIIGLDVWNEPAEGGLKYYDLTPAEWHEQKLWPFYKKIRKSMNAIGWKSIPIFAEPSTFWNGNLPIIVPRGSGFLKDIPKEGFVFNAHFYDETREGLDILAGKVYNGAYLKGMDEFREEGRYLGQVPFVSEYGAWGRKKKFDTSRMMKALYQSMETTKTSEKRGDKYIDFYAPLVSGTQWSWDGHAVRESDYTWLFAGNGYVQERAYPRRVQGHIMSTYYNDMAQATYDNADLKWAAIRLSRKEYFTDYKFLWLVWRGRKSDAPTEVYLPRHFNRDNTLIMTEKSIIHGLTDFQKKTYGNQNELFFQEDWTGDDKKGGTRLFVYDDKDSGENQETYHYMLVVEIPKDKAPAQSELREMQERLRKKLILKESPVYLLGKVKMDTPKKARPHAKSRY